MGGREEKFGGEDVPFLSGVFISQKWGTGASGSSTSASSRPGASSQA